MSGRLKVRMSDILERYQGCFSWWSSHMYTYAFALLGFVRAKSRHGCSREAFPRICGRANACALLKSTGKVKRRIEMRVVDIFWIGKQLALFHPFPGSLHTDVHYKRSNVTSHLCTFPILRLFFLGELTALYIAMHGRKDEVVLPRASNCLSGMSVCGICL